MKRAIASGAAGQPTNAQGQTNAAVGLSKSTSLAASDVVAILATIAAVGIVIWIMAKTFKKGSTPGEHLLGLAGLALIILWADKSQFLATAANAGSYLAQNLTNLTTKG